MDGSEPTVDDLLPKNDTVYEPPQILADLFADGAPAFELQDFWKLDLSDLSEEQRRTFRLGWEAGLFELLLKTGISFWLPVRHENANRLAARARMFDRKVEVQHFDRQSSVIVESRAA